MARAEHPKQRLGCRRGPSRIPWHLRACLSQTGRGDYPRRRGLQEEPEGERSDPRADLLNEGRSRIYGQRSCPAPPPGTRSARSTAMARSPSTSSPTGRGSTASRCPAGWRGFTRPARSPTVATATRSHPPEGSQSAWSPSRADERASTSTSGATSWRSGRAAGVVNLGPASGAPS